MTTSKTEPLNKSELHRLQEVAKQRGNQGELLLVDIVPYTGLYSHEFTHLRKQWYDSSSEDTPAVIQVPPQSTCTRIKFASRQSVIRTTEVCQYCEEETRRWEVEFDHRVRQIPIKSDQAIRRLNNWFALYDEIPLVPNSLAEAIRNLGYAAGFERDLVYDDLRHTFIKMLADQGFEKKLIAKYAGYSTHNNEQDAKRRVVDNTIRDILRASSTDYDIRNRVEDQELLNIIEFHAPFTSIELQQITGCASHSISTRINRYEELGKIKKIGKRETETSGPNPAEWDTTESFSKEFECPSDDCNRSFERLSSCTFHHNKMHSE